jgi:hypothetical protein
MSFPRLLRIIEELAGAELCAKIEARARDELGGQKVYIGTRAPLRPEDVQRAGPDNGTAARRLRVHRSTAWRLRRMVR